MCPTHVSIWLANPRVPVNEIESHSRFLKNGQFRTGENRGKQEIFWHNIPQKQCYSSNQLPPLSVII
jgi:hypothetical protein